MKMKIKTIYTGKEEIMMTPFDIPFMASDDEQVESVKL